MFIQKLGEEVVNPKRNIPLSILITLGIVSKHLFLVKIDFLPSNKFYLPR